MEHAIEICAVMAFSAIKNGDKVGLVLFSDRIEKVIPPKKGRTHVLRLIRELYTTRPSGTRTSISTALSFVYWLLKRRYIVILASDFLDNVFDIKPIISFNKYYLVYHI